MNQQDHQTVSEAKRPVGAWEQFKHSVKIISKYIAPMEGEHFDNMQARINGGQQESPPASKKMKP